MTDFAQRAAQNLAAIRRQKPLIHNITNYVVMNSSANTLLALGASPVMAHAPNEVEQMVSFAGALVLNIGTLSDAWIEAMLRAGRKATELGTPIVFDPVGSGATTFRTETAHKILEQTRVSVVRGNASEILSLHGADSKTKGVDSVHSVREATAAAQALARDLGATLAITGPTDLITDGHRTAWVNNGHALMATVTGTGCAATATIGAFCAVDTDVFQATTTALAFFGLAGEKAAEKATAPGSYQVALLDALFELTPESLAGGCRIDLQVSDEAW